MHPMNAGRAALQARLPACALHTADMVKSTRVDLQGCSTFQHNASSQPWTLAPTLPPPCNSDVVRWSVEASLPASAPGSGPHHDVLAGHAGVGAVTVRSWQAATRSRRSR